MLAVENSFSSVEEKQFYYWCEEAKEHGFISAFEFQPESLELCPTVKRTEKVQLKTKEKWVERHLMHGHSYTADFKIWPTDKFLAVFPSVLYKPDNPERYYEEPETPYWIDTKGNWMNRGAKQEFSINQKWVWDKHRIYINKVVPKKFFKQTWVPQRVRYSEKTGKMLPSFLEYKTVEQVCQT